MCIECADRLDTIELGKGGSSDGSMYDSGSEGEGADNGSREYSAGSFGSGSHNSIISEDRLQRPTFDNEVDDDIIVQHQIRGLDGLDMDQSKNKSKNKSSGENGEDQGEGQGGQSQADKPKRHTSWGIDSNDYNKLR